MKALRTLKSFSWLGRLQNHMQQVFLNSYQTEIEKILKCWLDKVQYYVMEYFILFS